MANLTYYDSAEGESISRDGVIRLFRQHGIPESEWAEFFEEFGQNTLYDGQAVLRWLGY
ncbi:hypothetical protein ABKU49_05480 [Enterobacter hormaechei]